MIREAPRIETERLVLRHWRKDDFRPWLDIMKQPEVHKYLGAATSAEEAWRRLTAAVGGWQFNGYGTWAVELKATGALVGNVGIFNAWRDLQPEFGDEPEMGWIFSSDTHGQGLGTEACRSAIGWAEANLAPTPLWAIVAPENVPSLSLAAKLGFERLHVTDYHGDATVVLKRPAWA